MDIQKHTQDLLIISKNYAVRIEKQHLKTDKFLWLKWMTNYTPYPHVDVNLSTQMEHEVWIIKMKKPY